MFPGNSTIPGCTYDEIVAADPGGNDLFYLYGTQLQFDNVTWITPSNGAYISATQIGFTVAVGTVAPTETLALSLTCDGCSQDPQGTVKIGCIIPTITSISPNVWPSGTPTSITIKGTGLTTTAAATAVCPATKATVTTPDGSVVTVSNVNVTSASQITADLQPALSTPTEGATLKVSGAQSATAAVQICARPTISSITPKTWLEGETYSVTIAGTGFTTAAAATAGCPTSTLTATAGRGTVTISSVNVVSAIQLTAKVEAPANVPNETANVTVSATIPPLGIAFIEGCPLPASEATAFQGWSSSTIGTWEQTLSDPSGDSFSGATVEETKAGPGADTCWFPNSAFAAFTDISGGRWPVAANNTWGTDSVGWSADYVAYYRAQGRAPCGFNVQQQMLIQCSADYVNASDYYSDYGTVNILQANITATTVTSSRAGTTETEIH